MKECLYCGKVHNNVSFCSKNCSCSYYNKLRVNKKKPDYFTFKGHKQSDETKKTISKKLKDYYNDNPDKQNWLVNRNKSKPCEFLKHVLRDREFFFIEELKPLNDYSYSIDIALPEYKIGIEVNGNQHYKKCNQFILDDYYQIRHDLIEKSGWKLVELHYKTVYDKNINLIIDKILIDRNFYYSVETKKYLVDCINKLCKKCGNEINTDNICEKCLKNKEIEIQNRLNIKQIKEIEKQNRIEDKYNKRINKKLNKYNICECGNKKLHNSNFCKECNKIKYRKIIRPSSEDLHKDVNILGFEGTGRKYGVTGNSIKKWIIFYKNN